VDDYRITAATLRRQAAVAAEHDNPQLAANFERAAELSTLDDGQVLAIYEALRPHRSSGAELDAIAQQLRLHGAERTSALIAEARQVYARRGLLRDE
jgi:propanediol dehydratase small subunit